MSELACVVLALGAPPELVDAVRSVLRQAEPVEVVVVNTGGGDAAGRMRAAGLDVPVIERPDRLYAGGARNLGVAATSAPYVAFLACDCRAEPGWAAARLRRHRLGMPAVASAIVTHPRHNASAAASTLLLHHRRLPGTPRHRRLSYGLSYDRTLFDRFGPFRDDLRGGEDTDFNARLANAGITIVFGHDVRTAHREPDRLGAFLADQWARGWRQARNRSALAGRPVGVRVGFSALSNPGRALVALLASPERRRLARGVPLLPAGAAAYAAGAFAEAAQSRWRRRRGIGRSSSPDSSVR